MSLTDIQKAAVEAAGKNILVSAGAGTGKTRVLVERFLYWVLQRRALVPEILALTFTEKAATEMKSRLRERFKELGLETERRELEQAYISTIHSFTSRILREHPVEAGIDPEFSVLEQEEAELLKEQALDAVIEEGCANKDGTFEILKEYGESTVRTGLERVLTASRIAGHSVEDFLLGDPFSWCSEKRSGTRSERVARLTRETEAEIAGLFRSMNEDEFLKDFRRFSEDRWDWPRIREFEAWFRYFSSRGGKEHKEKWKRIKVLCAEFAALKKETFTEPWRQRFETLALAFEARYEILKQEKGYLDFDDLQVKTVRLLESEEPGAKKLREIYRAQFRHIMIDEFQDTNPLQLRLVKLLASGDHLFFVGDYKQSIYGFRGTSPDQFRQIENEYRASKSGVRIPLLENFRSREPVLEFINRFFRMLWEEDGLEFEDLIARMESSESGRDVGPAVEFLVTSQEDGEELDRARVREAAWMAQRIQELAGGGYSFGDIAILFQAMTTSGIYEQALKQAGIPYFVVAGRGFYQQPEVRDMMSCLACIENPFKDIPLAASLRSPMFQVSDDAVFWLAQTAKKDDESSPLYRALEKVEDIEQIPEKDRNKILQFRGFLYEMQTVKDRLKLTELLDAVIKMTSFELYVLAGIEGVRRYANLRKLVDLARMYESRGRMPLADFLSTIQGLEYREIRESEAQVEAEQSGRVVRLMTVHAAKGLEFPVVMLADLAHHKQSADVKTILAESGAGSALQVKNPSSREAEDSYSWIKIHEAIKRREKEEWKRLLYVAATRAKERLIFSGVTKPKKSEKDSFRDMSSWMDWLLAAADELGDVMAIKNENPCRYPKSRLRNDFEKMTQDFFHGFQYVKSEELYASSAELETVRREADRLEAQTSPVPQNISRVIDLPVSAYLVYLKNPHIYRATYDLGFPAAAQDENRDDEPVSDEGMPAAAEYGTLIHRILECIDFRNPGPSLSAVSSQILSGLDQKAGEDARAMLSEFFKSKVFSDIRKAPRVYREISFVLDERHGRINGVIDLLYQDSAGRWHILDYKTAVGDADKAVRDHYDIQIAIYGLAVYHLLKQVPATGTVYFLKNQKPHTFQFDQPGLDSFGVRLRQIQEEMVSLQ